MGKGKYLNELKRFLKNLSKDFLIKKIILFGSRARGDEREDSDIDIIIISNDFENMSFFERGAAMYNYWDLKMPVDFICYTEEEFNTLRKKISIVKEALKNGIIIRQNSR